MLKSVLLVVFGLVADISAESEWSYNGNCTGPVLIAARWGEEWETCYNGSRQSPIALNSKKAVRDPRLINSPLQFENYDQSIDGVMSNNGNLIRFTVSDRKIIDGILRREELPRIWGGGYGSNGYILSHIDFHWGSRSNPVGSEHRVNGKKAVIEVQLIHYNGGYQSYESAKNFNDGVAAVALLLVPNPEPVRVEVRLEEFVEALPSVGRESAGGTNMTLDLTNLVPKPIRLGRAVYFRYEGSLTSPPCSEVVSWSVFERSLFIQSRTLTRLFQNIMSPGFDYDDSQLVAITENVRPLQQRNGRLVRTNRPRSHPYEAIKSIQLSRDNNGEPRPFACLGSFLCLPVQ